MSQHKRSLVVYLFLALLILGLVFLFRQNKALKSEMHILQLQVAQQDLAIDSIRSRGLTDLMSHVLTKVDTELKESPAKTISDETISRIAALSFSSKPYLLVENDSLGTVMLSPERGQLLLMLMRMQIDTLILDKVFLQSTFEYADLRNADLRKAYLKGANLNNAYMQDVNLQDANLSKASLKSVKLWGAYLENSQLQEADLRRADLSWSDMSSAHIQKAIFSGARLHSAQIRKADCMEANFRWADFTSSLILNADLSGADLTGANFTRAVLNGSNLKESIVLRANFTQSEMNNAIVSDAKWLDRLEEWLIKGGSDLANKYKVSKEGSMADQFYLRAKNH